MPRRTGPSHQHRGVSRKAMARPPRRHVGAPDNHEYDGDESRSDEVVSDKGTGTGPRPSRRRSRHVHRDVRYGCVRHDRASTAQACGTVAVLGAVPDAGSEPEAAARARLSRADQEADRVSRAVPATRRENGVADLRDEVEYTAECAGRRDRRDHREGGDLGRMTVHAVPYGRTHNWRRTPGTQVCPCHDHPPTPGSRTQAPLRLEGSLRTSFDPLAPEGPRAGRGARRLAPARWFGWRCRYPASVGQVRHVEPAGTSAEVAASLLSRCWIA
jgi:hypothetical protein